MGGGRGLRCAVVGNATWAGAVGWGMSTNYYAHRNRCEKCGRQDRPLHIGKSAAGWCFALRVYPESEELPHNLADWVALLGEDGVTVGDEYGDPVTIVEMLDTICNRSAYADRPLRRQRGDGVIPGSGPWDLVGYEFS